MMGDGWVMGSGVWIVGSLAYGLCTMMDYGTMSYELWTTPYGTAWAAWTSGLCTAVKQMGWAWMGADGFGIGFVDGPCMGCGFDRSWAMEGGEWAVRDFDGLWLDVDVVHRVSIVERVEGALVPIDDGTKSEYAAGWKELREARMRVEGSGRYHH